MDINKVFNDDKEINIVFLGGSITEGAGASDSSKAFANMTGEWLKQKFGDRLHYYNKGVGGTPSKYGLLRLHRDVIAYKPDMVFIEFAVNDNGEDTRIYVESIVRTLDGLPQKPYIAFIYTTNNIYTTDTKYYEELAEYYSIPQINLKDALKEKLKGEDAKICGYLADNLHPSDQGHKLYFETMIKCLENDEYYRKPDTEKAPITDSFEVQTMFIPSAEVKHSSGWVKDGWKTYQGMLAEKSGETLEFEFEGNIFAIEHGLHIDSGLYDIYIDDALIETIHPVYGTTASNQLVVGFDTFGLKNGKHTAKIVTKNSSNGGERVMIYNFIVGESYR